MTKHICGSCRFFQEGRGARHGWCTHPDRRETTAVRILVRAGELRCRNDWGDDLWQERTDSDRVIDVVMNESSSRSNPDSEARPIPRPLNAPPVVQPVSPVGQTARSAADEPPSLVSTNLNRELLQRAQERARERQRNRGYSATGDGDRPAPDPLPKPEREPFVISNQYVPPSRHEPEKSSQDSIFEFQGKGFDARFDERIGAEPVVPSEATVWKEEPDDSSVAAEPEELDDDSWSDSQAAVAQVAEVVLEDETRIDSEPEDRWARRPSRSEAVSRPRTVRERRPEPEDRFDEWADPIEVEPRDLLEPDFADDEAIGSWPPAPAVATTGGVWSGIVRTCQSCRDFRPAGNGERGWCNNQWAFKHRRMVDADDRPCETSIGHWWIPSDTAWLGTFDVSALGEPTPLVDKYITGGSERRTAEELPLRRRRQS